MKEQELCAHRGLRLWAAAALAVLVERPYGSFAYGCGTFNGFNVCILDDPARDLVAAMTCNKEEVGLRPLERLAGLIRKP